MYLLPEHASLWAISELSAKNCFFVKHLLSNFLFLLSGLCGVKKVDKGGKEPDLDHHHDYNDQLVVIMIIMIMIMIMASGLCGSEKVDKGGKEPDWGRVAKDRITRIRMHTGLDHRHDYNDHHDNNGHHDHGIAMVIF